MSDNLKALIDEVWQSPDGYERAEKLSQTMSVDQREGLKRVLQRVAGLSEKNYPGDSGSCDVGSAFLNTSSEKEEVASILFLLSLAIYHSDGLVFMPPELRRSRICSWGELTGIKEDIVLEAVKLGPERLKGLL
ncbi:hypothetical protein DES49_0538 [Halospina denitrificans]|uniref:Uncharacterized protein n=1 Tax=Halospina denitrificans TaxID=332522 RepID=A0A4R7K1I8_9GAMM|nr:hypothetical protein [Halospina denitrificans]TDT44435.1 hypothetical protein DES49_0538 [Halospina denitrificans]